MPVFFRACFNYLCHSMQVGWGFFGLFGLLLFYFFYFLTLQFGHQYLKKEILSHSGFFPSDYIQKTLRLFRKQSDIILRDRYFRTNTL